MTIEEILAETKRNWGLETVQAIKVKLQEDQIFYTGALADSIRIQQKSDSLDGDIDFLMTDYGKFIDEGVNAFEGSNWNSPYSFKGKWQGTAQAIKPWANSKGLNPFAVARTLQFKTGIKPRKFFKSVVEKRMENLAKDLEAAYIDYLTRITENRTQ